MPESPSWPLSLTSGLGKLVQPATIKNITQKTLKHLSQDFSKNLGCHASETRAKMLWYSDKRFNVCTKFSKVIIGRQDIALIYKSKWLTARVYVTTLEFG